MRAQCQNITLGNVYIASLYFSYWMDVLRGKMWKVRGKMLRTKDSADCQETVSALGDHRANCGFMGRI